jgi:hypothetical protein
MAFPSFDTATNSWRPQVDISWCSGSNRDSKFVRFADDARTEDEAVRCGLDKAIGWIDRRLKSAQ